MFQKVTVSVVIIILYSCNISKSNSVYDYYKGDNTLVLYSLFNETMRNEKNDSLQIEGINTSFSVDRFGNEGSSIELNGKSYVTYGNILNETFAGSKKSFTISFWLKPHNASTDVSLLCKNADSNCDENQRQLNLRLTSHGKVQFIWFNPSGYQFLESEEVVRMGKWSNLIVAYNGMSDRSSEQNRVHIYLNGKNINLKLKEKKGRLLSINKGNAYLAIGTMVNSSGENCTNNFYNGFIDDLLIFNRMLSANEIEHLSSIN